MTNQKGFATYLATTALGACVALPTIAEAQTADGGARSQLEEVVVSARRRDEFAQTVPISMTVFRPEDVSNLNIVTAEDLATYTPSLSVNNRFGSDNTSFSIRGFTEELRTTSSVGVYFADVVGPRGSNTTSSGNGAGPGAIFDLQNIQVLKGPQGTLFGRNTTGGAVLLVPQQPTEQFEGYVEASFGNYDMQRLQGVVNLPISEKVQVRLGVDDNQRDGYLENEGSIGPDRLADSNYTALRASMLVSLADNLENYTIFNRLDSSNKGMAGLILACHPDRTYRFAAPCQDQLATMSGDFYGFRLNKSEAESSIDQWQVINHLTWEINDELTLRNILSYTDLETDLVSSVFATDFYARGIPFGITSSDLAAPGIDTTAQNTFVAELQLVGSSFDDRLEWQTGIYYERSKPDGVSGSRPTRGVDCTNVGANPNDWECIAALGPAASITQQFGEVEYDNRAVYGQATYTLTDKLNLTTGLRYTWDKTDGTASALNYTGFPATSYGAPANVACINPLGSLPDCSVDLKTESDEPTWLVGLDYFLSPDVMLYAKYARGYRQGNVNLFGAPGFQTHEPEQLDSYEIGAKTSFRGPVPGTFNVALFYNELQDMQLQAGFAGIVNTTGILNAGEAVMQGAEIETTLMPFDGFTFQLGYSYLDTEIKEIAPPPPAPPGLMIIPAAQEGSATPWSPKHKVTATAAYQLPVPAEMGDIGVSLNYVYVHEQLVSVGSPFGVLPSYELFNLSANWNDIAGSSFDASMFVTNLLDEEYISNVYGNYLSFGAEFYNPGMPRMLGARLKYRF